MTDRCFSIWRGCRCRLPLNHIGNHISGDNIEWNNNDSDKWIKSQKKIELEEGKQK